VIGCFLSHFLLWERCAIENREILILEHNAIFLRALADENHDGLLNIGQPSWTLGLDTTGYEVQPDGVFTYPFAQFRGAFGYIIRPDRARELMDIAFQNGICSVDEFICYKNFPYFQAVKPPVVNASSQFLNHSKKLKMDRPRPVSGREFVAYGIPCPIGSVSPPIIADRLGERCSKQGSAFCDGRRSG
jgi:GR25 family glycosyltransferase involved in LPS biosynthesis